ncbi:MAG: hypothetical protein ACOCUT_00195 [bacterium]
MKQKTQCWEVLQNGRVVDFYWPDEELSEKQAKEIIEKDESYPKDFELNLVEFNKWIFKHSFKKKEKL